MAKVKNMLIGEMLLEEGIITKEQLKDALEEQKRTGTRIGEILIKMRYISKEILWTFLGYQMGVPFINLDEAPEVRPEVLKCLPETLMRNEKLMPVSKQGRVITVAMSDPLNFLVVDELKATTRSEIDTRLAAPEDIKKLIDKYFGFKDEDTGEIARARIDELDDILAAPMGRSKPKEDTAFKIQRSPYGGGAPKKEEPAKQQNQTPSTPQYQAPAYVPPQAQQHQPPEAQPAMQTSYSAPQQPAQTSVSADTPVNTFLTALISEAYDTNRSEEHTSELQSRQY